jgi:zinc D-Ala-D-Ala carboxypeptidase
MMDWSLYPNFSEAEMRCKHTGKCEMHPDFMERLQQLRYLYDRPMPVTSGFRDRTHPVERKKPAGSIGPHTTGRAVDIAVRGSDAYDLIYMAMACGFTGIGLRQHGNSRFVHLDDLPPGNPSGPRPWVWTYP